MLIGLLGFTAVTAEKGMPGGFSDAEVDEKVTKAAEVAVTALAGITGNTNPVSSCGKNIDLVGVDKVEKQVVAGTNYKLTLRLATHTPGNCNDKVEKVCEGITVYEKLPHMCSGDNSNIPCTELTNQQNIKCKDAPPTLGASGSQQKNNPTGGGSALTSFTSLSLLLMLSMLTILSILKPTKMI